MFISSAFYAANFMHVFEMPTFCAMLRAKDLSTLPAINLYKKTIYVYLFFSAIPLFYPYIY